MSFSKVRHAVSAETCALPDTYHTFGGKFTTHACFYLHAVYARERILMCPRSIHETREGDGRGQVDGSGLPSN